MNSEGKIKIKLAILAAIFFAGILLGLFFWEKIDLPFSNPWGVTGTFTVAKYNPNNDIVRFAVFMACPVMLLLAAYLLRPGKFRNVCFGGRQNESSGSGSALSGLTPAKRKLAAVILLAFTLLVAINHPTYHSAGRFDVYHEGESLGTSISYMNGKVPYRDFLFTHGLYQDPLRAVAAFKLFGTSIGSARALESIGKMLAFVLLSFFLIKFYKGNFLYCFTTLLFLIFLHLRIRFPVAFVPQFIPSVYAGFVVYIPQLTLIIPRDVTTFSFLITIAFLQSFIVRSETAAAKFFIISFLFSFIPLASFGYSIDRGFYLFAAYLILCPVLYFFFFRRSTLNTVSDIFLIRHCVCGNTAKFYVTLELC